MPDLVLRQDTLSRLYDGLDIAREWLLYLFVERGFSLKTGISLVIFLFAGIMITRIGFAMYAKKAGS